MDIRRRPARLLLFLSQIERAAAAERQHLPEERRQVGFDNLDFDFLLRGALFDGKCAARIPLPDYPVSAVRTGQFGPAGELWSAEAALEDGSPLR